MWKQRKLVELLCQTATSFRWRQPRVFVEQFCVVTFPDTETKSEDSKELSRPRLDTGKDIFSQLTSVFDDLPSGAKSKLDAPVETVNTDGDTTIIHISDSLDEVRYLSV